MCDSQSVREGRGFESSQKRVFACVSENASAEHIRDRFVASTETARNGTVKTVFERPFWVTLQKKDNRHFLLQATTYGLAKQRMV